MSAPRARLVQPHIAGCWAVEEVRATRWSTPWGCVVRGDRAVFFGNAWGHPSSSRFQWVRIRCNMPECTASAIVRADVLTDELTATLGARELVRTKRNGAAHRGGT